jgi:E1-E2 ATPase
LGIFHRRRRSYSTPSAPRARRPQAGRHLDDEDVAILPVHFPRGGAFAPERRAWLEYGQALGQARGALSALAELLPDEAERVRDGESERIPLSELRVGEVVLVRPGARVPADAEILDGRAEFDESMITGESRPVAKGEGDDVTAGTVATDSRFVCA